ncbi:division plane positioning ATPase MipZ [Pseudoroseomonas globiformis]|uniref:Division plane positioning ATPase MipZ n=1 Tax=Teichococcus globiformis TaxID=2307229 RepID=A0ABV7G308_9PROT
MARKPSLPKLIMLSSPKGGVGKSSLCRNVLVLAARAGHRAVGIDFDQQRTLATWGDRRERARASIPTISPVPVINADLADWRSIVGEAQGGDAEFYVIDTPPSIELDLNAILGLSEAADLVLVPCQQTQDDVDSVVPWMKKLANARKAAFVMNRSNRRAKSFGAIRAKLLAAGDLCPVEVPQLEEIPLAAGKGLGVMDLSRPHSAETFEALWSYILRRVSK